MYLVVFVSLLLGMQSFASVRGADPRPVSADPALAGETWFEQLHVQEAWAYATGKGVVIASCDAGYYVDESDLKANLLLDWSRDFSDRLNPFQISDGSAVYHGTASAAVMVAVRDGQGTNGIAFNARLVPLQNYNYDKSLDHLSLNEATAECIRYASQIPNVRILLVESQTYEGSAEFDIGIRNSVRAAVDAGVIVVTAAGNYAKELLTEADDDTGSIIVGAVHPSGPSRPDSNYGERITTSGIGISVRTLFGPKGELGSYSGTSAAAPQVAATVALMLEVNPSLTPAQVREILIATRERGIWNERVGGQLDVLAAVRAAKRL